MVLADSELRQLISVEGGRQAELAEDVLGGHEAALLGPEAGVVVGGWLQHPGLGGHGPDPLQRVVQEHGLVQLGLRVLDVSQLADAVLQSLLPVPHIFLVYSKWMLDAGCRLEPCHGNVELLSVTSCPGGGRAATEAATQLAAGGWGWLVATLS